MFVFKKFIFVLSFLFLALPSTLVAKPPLLEAIEAYETCDDSRAATLFRPLALTSPIVQPYIEALRNQTVLRGLTPAENLREYETDQYARGWFEVSKVLRELHKKNRKIEGERNAQKRGKLERERAKFISDKLLNKPHAAAWVANGDLIEKGLIVTGTLGTSRAAVGYYSGVLNEADEIDVRSLLALNRLGANVMVNGVDIIQRIPILQRLLDSKTMGDAIFEFAQLFQSTSSFYNKLIRSAAFFGSIEAQFAVAKDRSHSVEEAFYWFMQAAQQGHERSQIQVAHMLEKGAGCSVDPEKCFRYSRLGVDGLTAGGKAVADPVPYFNHAVRLYKGIGSKPDLDQAEVYFKLAIDAGGDDDIELHYGTCLNDNGKVEEAKRVWLTLAQKGNLDALQNYAAVCANPEDYQHLLPLCLKLAETDDRALKLVTQLVCHSYSKTIDLVHLYDLLGRFETSSDLEEQIFSYLRRAALLLYLNEEGHLKGDAIDLLRKAVDLGSADAAYELAQCYQVGKLVASNVEEALRLYRIAEAGGVWLSHQKIGHLLMERHDPSVDAEALEHVQKAAGISSNLQLYAKYNLAIMHINERGGAKQDFPYIEKLLRECMGDPELRLDSSYELAKCEFLQMAQGMGDKAEHFHGALSLLEDGVKVDHAPSLFLKGQILAFHEEDNLDLRREGIELIRAAAKKNYPAARMAYAALMIFRSDEIPGGSSPEKTMMVVSGLSEKEQALFFNQIYAVIKGALPPEAFVRLEEDSDEEQPDISPQLKEKEPEDSIKDEAEKPEAKPIDPRLARLLKKFDKCTGKKQVKWRKIQGVMQQFMSLTSGGFSQGKGSGLHIKLAGMVSGLHVPHGKNKSELTGGRLESMRGLLEQAMMGTLEEEQLMQLLEGRDTFAIGDSSASNASASTISPASSSAEKKSKKKKGKKRR